MVNYLRHAESLYFLESNAVDSPHRTRSSKPVKDASSKVERGPNELTSTHLTELFLFRNGDEGIENKKLTDIRQIRGRGCMFPFGNIDVINTNNVLPQYGHVRGLHTTQLPSDSEVIPDLVCRNGDLLEKSRKLKRELELSLIPRINKSLKEDVWPTTDSETSNMLKAYIHVSTYIVAITSAARFIPTTQLKMEGMKVILADKFKPFDPKRPGLLVNREAIKDPASWRDILEEASHNLESLPFKLWSVDEISRSEGRLTPGVDKKAFRTIPRSPSNREEALIILQPIIDLLKRTISISEGKTDQAIKRKGPENLNEREKLRRYLKTPVGKIRVRKSMELLTIITNDPMKYLQDKIEKDTKYNLTLKFALLQSLKKLRIRNYKSDDVLRVFIPKANGKLRPLVIPTLKDRTIQMLLKSVMEPYLEPLGDRTSFGFRPGRNCHQATSYLHHRLQVNTSDSNNRLAKKNLSLLKFSIRAKLRAKKYETLKPELEQALKVKYSNIRDVPMTIRQLLKRDSKTYFNSTYILDADIKGCFDNISHDWLILNVPMPLGYDYLLPRILKPNIVEKGAKSFITLVESKDNHSGIPQGGIISPLLMNFTLDGLEKVIRDSLTRFKNPDGSAYFDQEKYEFYLPILGEKESKRYAMNLELKTSSWMVRYADDFIVGVKSEVGLLKVKEGIETFLNERGLTLSPEKTRIIKWKANAKVNFLSWTHHYLVPGKVSWIIRTPKSKAGRLTDWIGNYTYPSKKAITRLKEAISLITSHANTWETEESIIKQLRYLVLGWSNYFTPGPKQGALRLALDWYIYKRMKRFIFSKYGNSYLIHFLRLNQNEDGTRKVQIGLENQTDGRTRTLSIPRLYDLNTPQVWSQLTPVNDILNHSFLVFPAPYVKRAIGIAHLRGDVKSKLMLRQKSLCSICEKQLVIWENLLLREDIDLFMDKFNQSNIHPENYGKAALLSCADYQEWREIELNSQTINEKIAKRTISLLDSRTADWSRGLNFDHIVPIALADRTIPLISLLNGLNNLTLVHAECHKTKTLGETERSFLKEMRRIRKSLLPEGIKLREVDSKTRTDITCKTILVLNAKGSLDRYKGLSRSTSGTINRLLQIAKGNI